MRDLFGYLYVMALVAVTFVILFYGVEYPLRAHGELNATTILKRSLEQINDSLCSVTYSTNWSLDYLRWLSGYCS